MRMHTTHVLLRKLHQGGDGWGAASLDFPSAAFTKADRIRNRKPVLA